MSKNLSRRDVLKAAGVTLALPFLESSAANVNNGQAKRLVAFQMPFGFLAEKLYPKNGSDLSDSRYMKTLESLKDSVTLYNGLYNPGINGGHEANNYYLTCGSKTKKVNSISIDQEIASRYKGETRFKSLVAGTGLRAGASYTRSGIKIPAQEDPKKVFETMFLGGSSKDVQRKKHELMQGKSILDAFSYYSIVRNRYSGNDRAKIDQYFTSVREVEKELKLSEAWLDKPMPKVKAPTFPSSHSDEMDNFRTFTKVFKLVLETDSTRLITYDFGQTRKKIHLDGINEGYHGLSHHRMEKDKINQLYTIEMEMFKIFSDFLKDLKDSNLLNSTLCLFGSGLENPNNHSAARPPIILAGGGLKHKGYVNYGERRVPLGNMYLSILERMGVNKGSFGSSSGKLDI